MSAAGERLAAAIATEREHIMQDSEARNPPPAVHVLAIASMGMDAHAAIDNCGLDKETEEFARIFIDQAYAKALRARGWTVRRPGES